MPSFSESHSSDELVHTVAFVVDGVFEPVATWQAFLECVNCCGLAVINSVHHMFPPGDSHGGLSGVVQIMESHAAIHTWPEHGKAWVMLATCGDERDLEDFQRMVESQAW